MGYRYAITSPLENNAPEGWSHDSSNDQDGGAGARRSVRVRRDSGCGAEEGRPSPRPAFDPRGVAPGCVRGNDQDPTEAACDTQETDVSEEDQRKPPPGHETALTNASADQMGA